VARRPPGCGRFPAGVESVEAGVTPKRRQLEPVLICEPHPEMRAFLVRLLEHVGRAAVVWPPAASAGRSAGILIADVASEEGLKLAQQAIAQHPGLPLILITLGPLPSEAAELDAVAVLEKPFALSEFTRALDAAAKASAALS
jgi:FixJ family two-component response regulator